MKIISIIFHGDSRVIRHVPRDSFEFKRLVRPIGTWRQIFLRFSRDVRGTWHGQGLWISTTWSPFMVFPGQDPQDRRESKWRTSYGRVPAVSLVLTRSPIVYRSVWRLSTPFVIRENLETRPYVVCTFRDSWKRSPWVVVPPGIRC